MPVYKIRSGKSRTYKRTILIDGQHVTISVDKKQGTITSPRKLSAEAMLRIEKFYNVMRESEPTREEEPVQEEVQQETQPEVQQEVQQEVQEEVQPSVQEDNNLEEESFEDTQVEDTQVEETQAEETQEVQESSDDEDEDTPTAEQISRLYEEHGTWAEVARQLDISTSTLRKYREEFGLV